MDASSDVSDQQSLVFDFDTAPLLLCLGMGRKAVSPMCFVLHAQEPIYTYLKVEKDFALVFLAVAAECRAKYRA